MTQSDRVLRFLREHDGATAMELTMGLDPYVSNVRARISDLRAEGHVIQCRKRTDKRQGYWVVEPGQRTLGLTA